MKWKAVAIGGIVFWLVTNLVGFLGTGIVIHQQILEPLYRAHESFWLPELNQDPPNVAALMPRWLATSLLVSLIVAALYTVVRPSFAGPGWKAGLAWGFSLAVFAAGMMLSWSGVINLPMRLWSWWMIDGVIVYLIGGAAMGWASERFAGT